jgi:ABC-2 type transport system permease protein
MSATWFAGLIRAEWIKFRGTRSSYYSLLTAAAAAVLIGTVIAESVAARWNALSPAQRGRLDPLGLSFQGFQLAQLIIGTLGVLMISSEYSSGLIRATFAAAPQRRAVLAAKAAVVGLVTLIVGELVAFAAFFPAQAALGSTGQGLSIASPGALRAVAVTGLYVAVVAVTGLALGALTRHTAGAVAALFALFFLIPGVVSAFPDPWSTRIGKWLPGDLIGTLDSLHPHVGALSRPACLVVLLAYPAVLLTAAAWRLRTRDA